MEALLAELWRSALRVEQIGRYDNFFDLGGHSLLAMQVVTELERRTGIRVNPREIVLQTLGQLAAVCEQREPTRSTEAGGGGLSRRIVTALRGLVARR
jgi:acyl carrier protein